MAMARKMLALNMAVMAIGVLMMAQETTQLSIGNPLRSVVDRINDYAASGSYIGLVLPSDKNERALRESGVFKPSSSTPYVDIIGRRYHVGSIGGNDVIYVKTGKSSTNAVQAVQVLLDKFKVRGVVHMGSAGSLNNSLNIGDVAVFDSLAFTGSWTWKKHGSTGDLNFRDYNERKGENLLGSIDYEKVTLYTPSSNAGEKMFWFPVDSNYLSIAKELKGLKLEQCLNEASNCLPTKFINCMRARNCLSTEPQIVYGLKGSSSGIYIENESYRSFLHKTFGASTADTESADVAWTSMSNGVPYIVFRGVTNKAGAQTESSNVDYGYLASVNVVRVAAAFIQKLPSPRAM